MQNNSSMLGVSSHSPAERDAIAVKLAQAVTAAGPAILEVYEAGCTATLKGDGSPLTEADLRAQEKILAALARLTPGIPVVSEEDSGERAPCGPNEIFILVDPLDGTREFLARNGEFTVNAALIERGAPVAGAVYAPVLGELWVGGAEAFHCGGVHGETPPPKSQWRPISGRVAPAKMTALASRSHLDPATKAFLEKLPIGESRSAGSSLKFCLLAEGKADVYPRFGPTMEWDTAAGHAVLLAAGGVVLREDGAPLSYGKTESGLRNPSFIAWGRPPLARS
jgi:3'(2'), 5'-bisphosphate nucleotidase